MIINMMSGAMPFNAIARDGGSLTVIGVVGDTVTIKQGSTTYTQTLDTNRAAVFKNLKSGVWTVTMTNGFALATQDVSIAAADYTITLAYPVITVTYPVGSTCTMTDGTKTIIAPNTTGTWECVIPNLGTWTVSCTNGTETVHRDVSITTYGQIESLILAYMLWLFNADNGGDITANTGGWNTETTYNATVSITASALDLKGIGQPYEFHGETYWHVGTASAITKKSIDVTGFNTMHVTASVSGSYQQVVFGESVFDLTNGTTDIDISAITGEYNIKLTAYGYSNNGNNGYMTATKVWLTCGEYSTNLLASATDTDGSIYNGTGYASGYRLNSSGVAETYSGMYLTGFIPISLGDVVRLKDVTWQYGVSSGITSNNQRICFYDASKTFLGLANGTGAGGSLAGVKNENNIWTQFTVKSFRGVTLDNVAYFRLCCAGISSDSIITVNEEIGGA